MDLVPGYAGSKNMPNLYIADNQKVYNSICGHDCPVPGVDCSVLLQLRVDTSDLPDLRKREYFYIRSMNVQKFKAGIELIGINPFVSVPAKILKEIFSQAGKDRGHIPVRGSVNRKSYKQTLVKYSGEWRLYINTTMLKDSPKRIGEIIAVTIRHDPEDRTIQPHPGFAAALNANKKAKKAFDALPPSRKKEIVRYISALKAPESVNKNILRAIGFLTGDNRFVGRDKP
jgi:hypothetical protein